MEQERCAVMVDAGTTQVTWGPVTLVSPCGEPVEYVAATPPEYPYSGWHHVNRALDADHNAVPESHVS